MLETFGSRIAGLREKSELVHVLAETLSTFGLVAFNYGCGYLTEHNGIIVTQILSTLDPEWINYYANNGLYREDRLVRAAFFRVEPFRYEDVFCVAPISSRQREMETRFGYRSGVIVPIHGRTESGGVNFGILSAAAPNADPQPAISWETVGKVQLLATIFHQRLQSVRLPPMPALEIPAPVLTARERECLGWASGGKTNGEIGALIGVSERTAKKHVESAMGKLDSRTRAQAVARAISLGLIET